MEKETLNQLVQLRAYVIERYNALEGKDTSISVQSTQDVAKTLESIVRSLEDVLKNDVNFAK